MFISREYDYALRILRALAGGSRVSVGRICEIEHIPQHYAYKIAKKLEKASIIKAHRGAQGGCELAGELSDVSFYDVYEAVEGKLCLNECMREGYHCPNNYGVRRCSVHRELLDMQEQIVLFMKERKMSDILEIEQPA